MRTEGFEEAEVDVVGENGVECQISNTKHRISHNEFMSPKQIISGAHIKTSKL